MYVRLLRHHLGHKPGKIFNAPDGVANVLIKRHVAELSDEPRASQETRRTGAGKADKRRR